MRYSVQPKDWIFVKGYGSLSFAKYIGKNIDNNKSKNLGGKHTRKLLEHAKESATDAFKNTSKKLIQKRTEATGDLVGNKNADKITKISKNVQQNNSETITNEHDKEIPNERYISSDKGRNLIDDLNLI